MRLSGFDLCIKCNCGGKLLVCRGDDCPIVVHEKCIGCPARFGDVGEFDCPYCVFRKAYAELNQAREDVKLMKGALSSFIDAKVADCDKQKEISDRQTRKRKARAGEAENVERFNQQGDTSKGVDPAHNLQGDNHENDNMSGSPSVQEKPSEVEKDDSKSLEEIEINENNLGRTASSNEDNPIFDFTSGADGEGETSNKRSKPRKGNSPSEPPSASVDCSGRASPILPKNPTKTKKTIIGSEVSQDIYRAGRRILWTEQEVEMIKKGVTKYTSRGNRNIPWKKIFEYGRHVFHYSRTPTHLKDRWRTMLAKQNLAN